MKQLSVPTFALALILSACAGTPVPSGAPVSSSSDEKGQPSVSPSTATVDNLNGLPDNGQAAQVIRVVDGDTIEVQIDGVNFVVRYIGIDTPETVRSGVSVEYMGPEASAANKALVENKPVYLERDVSEIDRYGRLLRYVYVQVDGKWVMAGEELLRQGLAQVSTYPPDVRHTDRFLQVQSAAREAGVGLWSGDISAGSQAPIIPAGELGAPFSEGCDPAYPDFCVPVGIDDLNCPDFPQSNFRVLPPDTHKVDADGNGWACS